MDELTVSNELLSDPERLDDRFRSAGYLFFRDVLDKSLVTELVKPLLRELQVEGIASEAAEPTSTGRPVEDMNEQRLHEVLAYDRLWHAPDTIHFFERLFHEPVWVFRQTQIRVMAPSKEVYDTPAHQDGGYIKGTEFRTFWTPLVDAPPEIGGLGLVPGSHLRGPRLHVACEDKISFTHRLNVGGVELEPEEAFATADYRVGDVVAFHPYMVHRSQPNRSADRLRLSMDVRVQPARSERGYVATHTAMEARENSRASAGWFPDTKVVTAE
jgi:1-deoxypentalenic acid 11beta-hydroxylase